MDDAETNSRLPNPDNITDKKWEATAKHVTWSLLKSDAEPHFDKEEKLHGTYSNVPFSGFSPSLRKEED